MSLKYRKI